MSYSRNASVQRDSNSNAPRTGSWVKRIIVALAVTGVIGTVLVVMLAVMAFRFVGGAVDYLQSMDLATMESRMAEAALDLDQRQREIIGPLFDKLKSNELALPQREEVEKAIMEALTPQQRKQLEAWQNNGIMESIVHWLEELGVPVGLFMGNGEESPQMR